jgi:hypothetical protein
MGLPTYPTVTPGNMELSPAQVFFQGPSDNSYVEIGGTLGNVVITTKYSKADIRADQYGDSILDRRVSGLMLQITTEFAEILNKNLMKYLFPHGVIAGSSPKYFKFVSNIGDGDLSNSGKLKLHPQAQGSNIQFDWIFPKACASADSVFTLSPKDQIKAKIVWNVLPDTTTSPALWATLGDTTL